MIKFIRIQGTEFSIDFSETLNLVDQPGVVHNLIHEILLSTSLAADEEISTLLHEILEVIKYRGDLPINHQTLSTIGSMLHQVLKDNPEFLKLYLEENK